MCPYFTVVMLQEVKCILTKNTFKLTDKIKEHIEDAVVCCFIKMPLLSISVAFGFSGCVVCLSNMFITLIWSKILFDFD